MAPLPVTIGVPPETTRSSWSLIKIVAGLITRRGRSAQELIVGLKQALGRALEGQRRAAPPLAKADVVSDRDMKFGGLPGLDLDPLRARCRCSRPWWTTLLPGLAARTIRNDLQERFGPAIREV